MRLTVLLGFVLASAALVGCKSPPGSGTQAYMASATSEETQDFYPADASWEGTTVRRAEATGEGEALFTDQRSWNLPGANVSLDDAARMLAGMGPARASDGFADVRRTEAWRRHQREMDKMWSDYEGRHERAIRQWTAQEMPDLAGAQTLFYPFSGPDFLFAQAFFPKAETMVMCGLEPAEGLPTMNQLSPSEVSAGLASMRTAISSVIQFSFFITKDMRNDLVSSRFRGVLPIMMVFMARSGHSVESVDAIRVAGDGSPVITPVEAGGAPGLMIRCRSPRGSLVRVFYVKQNLADDSLSPGSPFLAFVRQVAPGVAFTKSASYLMHESYFSTIRNHLLNERPALVQDPSGVPYRNFDQSRWDLRLYGNYQRTLPLFGDGAQQPDLAQAYAEGRHGVRALPFGIGYLYQPEATCLMVGRRR